jgi:DNA repair exonuclease SbcCD ATPase subunit
MLSAAIDVLMNAYGRDDEINRLKKIKDEATEKLKNFSSELLEEKRRNAENLKPCGEADTLELLRYVRACSECELYQLHYDTYSGIVEHPGKEQELKNNMQKEIKRLKGELKEAVDFYTAFRGVQMELKS